MAHHEILNDDIVCIDTAQHRPCMAACYLVGSDGHYAFVESGTSLSVPLLLEALAELGVPREAVDYVMPTHVHLDHAGGAGEIMRRLPRAKLVVHPRGARHMIDPSKLWAGALAVYGEETMRRHYGSLVPVDRERVVEAPDGFTLELAGRPLNSARIAALASQGFVERGRDGSLRVTAAGFPVLDAVVADLAA